MPKEKNKWIDAVGKLITLTQDENLFGERQVSYDIETDYAGKTLRLYTVNDDGMTLSKLVLIEPGSGVVWEFPYSEANEHLMEAARYQLVGGANSSTKLLAKALKYPLAWITVTSVPSSATTNIESLSHEKRVFRRPR